MDTAPAIVTQPTNFDSSIAVANLWKATKTCFIDAPSMYVNKFLHNETALKMAAFTTMMQLEEHADKTSKILALDRGPEGKIAKFVEGATKHKEKVALKRKARANDNKLKMSVEELRTASSRMKVLFDQEKKKLIKIEAQLKAIKSTNNPKTLPNKEGGSAKGASKTINLATRHPQRRTTPTANEEKEVVKQPSQPAKKETTRHQINPAIERGSTFKRTKTRPGKGAIQTRAPSGASQKQTWLQAKPPNHPLLQCCWSLQIQ
jgi:hypothetical protein